VVPLSVLREGVMLRVTRFRLFAFTFALGALSYVVASSARADTAPPTCPPPPTGATGCKCAAAACTAPTGGGVACAALFAPCTKDTDCYGNTLNGTYFAAVAFNPETCVAIGPLSGSGCNNGNQADCTVRRTCSCDMIGRRCTTSDSAINPGGTYQPCQVVIAVPGPGGS
jgi:hypothetical protein